LSAVLPSKYWFLAFVGIAIIYILHKIAQGRKTTRERDLHARVILVTGAFTSLGLALLRSLAERGAHIIALSPDPINSPKVDILISLLRSTTNNEQIFAEECDLASPESIRSLCSRFLTSENNRLDAIVFTHEYPHIGSWFSRGISESSEKERHTRSLATFLITTLLIPILLVAPQERDIRILNVVNPYYAAALRSFSPVLDPSHNKPSMILQEGRRSLQTIILTRHLQRILDSMPQGHIPKAEENVIPVVNTKLQRSNIVAVSVSPGISRVDTMAPLMAASTSDPLHFSYFGLLYYLILQPLLRIITKSSDSAIQTILHSLFLPTPLKSSIKETHGQDELTTEVLKPGSFYTNCSVQALKISQRTKEENGSGNAKRKGKGKDTERNELPDDGELGGEELGRHVWESYEKALKVWEETSSLKTHSSPSAEHGNEDENK